MTRARDIKKSDFVAVSAFQAGDYIDIVRNGQNYKVSQSDFLASLTALGSLSSIGEVAAIPVLKQVATANYIRAILGGSGITTSLSTQDGVEISHNFNVDQTGAAVMANETAVQPTFRSIVGGTGITVAESGDIIQISESGTPGTSKTVFVYQESDFPTPVSGVITLAGDTEYRIVNDVSTASRFVMGAGTVIQAPDDRLITLTYTGSNTMITALDNSCTIKGIKLSCTSAQAFDISSTTGDHEFIFTEGTVDCDTVGTIDELNLTFFRSISFIAATDGLAFSGTNSTFYCKIFDFDITATGAKAFDLGSATFLAIAIGDGIFILADATSYCIAGLANDGNIAAGGFASITTTQQFGSGTFLENISPYDDLWEFALNPNAVNSTNLALATHGGATITIAASATPVIVGATWTAQANHRFTITSGGRFTYTGKGAHLDITASISVDLASGIDDISFFLYINDVQVAASQITREVNSGDIGNMSLIWSYDFATDDYVELWVQNDDTTANVIIENIIMRISG